MASSQNARRALWLVLALSPVAWLHAGSPAKAPPPDPAAQAKALQLIQEVFADDLKAATDPASRARLAAELLQQARETRDDPVLRFVLLREAADLAARGGDVAVAFSAIEEVNKTFALDALAQKAEALGAAVAEASTREAGKALLDAALPLIAEALDADNYAAARLLGQTAEAAARRAKSPSLVLDAQKRIGQVAVAEKGFAKQQGYLDRLKADPADAEAHRALGMYYGLVKRHWDKALPHLAAGDDAALQAIAARDLKAPRDTVAQAALADAWWELAGQQKEPARLALQGRAAFWYDKAIGQLTGLSRTKAQKRLDLVAARADGPAVAIGPVPVGEIKKLEGHSEPVKGVAFAPDGRHVASGGLDNSVRVWDVATGKETKQLRGHGSQVWAVAFHPNNRQLFSASWDKTVRLWDIASGNEAKRFTHPIDVNGLAIARDGATFLSASDDKNAYLWNTGTGDEVRRYPGHDDFVYAVAFAPGGKHIATGGVDRSVRVFELGTGQLLRACDSQTNPITYVAFTPDGKHVLSAGDNVIHVWDVGIGKEARRFEGHNGLIPAMALSPDGKRLVTGGEDRTIRLWDVATGKELHQLKGHTDTVSCLAFAPDGRRIVSGSYDRTVRVWGLPPL